MPNARGWFLTLKSSRAASKWAVFLVAASVTVGIRSWSGSVTAGASDQVAPSALPLVFRENLVYVGAFRLPIGNTDPTSFDYGGTALTYWPAHNSLLVVGHDWYQSVGEIAIPTPGTGSVVSALPRATLLQPVTDILQGRRLTIDGNTSNGVKIGGIVPFNDKFIVTAWSYYDAGAQRQTKSHFVTGQDFSSLGPVAGPFQVDTGYAPHMIAGFVAGYMAPIPSAWRSILGGTHLTGQGNGGPIISRTSLGPAATVFSPSDLGVTMPAPGTKVVGYPINYPTLGEYNVGGGLGLFNGTQSFNGVVFPEGTRSVLFFGSGGSRFCYGEPTPNPALDLTPVPGYPTVHFCFEPTPGIGKGNIGYPYRSLVYAYDVNDFVAVKNGTKQPWEIVPYATWPISMPFQASFSDRGFGPVDIGHREIIGAAYDPVTQRLFVSAYKNDGQAPVIYVFTVTSAPASSVNRLCY